MMNASPRPSLQNPILTLLTFLDKILVHLLLFLREYLYRWRGNQFGLKEAIFWSRDIDMWLRYTDVLKEITLSEEGPISILDVGAGGEGISQFLRYAKRVEKYRVTLVDQSQEKLRVVTLKKPTQHVIVANGRRLPFSENTFDLVVSVDTLEHVPKADRDQFLGELRRVSRKRLILHFPLQDQTGTFAGEESDRLFQEKHRKLFGVDEPNTLEHFEAGHPTYAEIKRLLPNAKIRGTQNAELWLQLTINARRAWIGFLSSMRFAYNAGDQMEKPPYHACLCLLEKRYDG